MRINLIDIFYGCVLQSDWFEQFLFSKWAKNGNHFSPLNHFYKFHSIAFFSVDINFNLHHCSVLNKFWKDLLIRNLSLVCKIKRLRISASITLKIHQEHDYDIFNLVEPLSATLNISNNSLEPNQQLESDHFFITWKLLSSKIWRSCWTNTFVSIDYLVNEYELLMKSDFV